MTHTNTDRTSDGTRRFSVTEAAGILGISTEATRQRIKRGTLETERDADGNVFVLLDVDSTRTTSNGTRTNTNRTVDSTALFERMSGEIEYLRHQLEVWQEEARRKDHIIAALTERIPELEPAREPTPEPREIDEASTDLHPGVDPQGDDAGRETSKSRSWWHRLFR